ncbi:hypothetical protein R1flu_027597 [Riccia fluitans]|uniref:WD repeat-containing protein 74 n=1 Tax=Riccia fluitans TaxID=41844 RepID=A0ABD1XJ94_9MARC
MPRTLKVDLPGVPRIRALCSDSLGLIKVIETEGECGAPKVIARWGDPDPQQGVICMSLSRDQSPSLAVARKSSTVDVIDPVNGLLESRLVVPKSSAEVASSREASDAVCGLHLFSEKSPWGKAVLTCTELGDAVLQELSELNDEQHPKGDHILSRWNVSQTGTVLCMAVDESEQFAVFGGKGVDVSLWDIKNGSRIWNAKAPHRDNLGLMSPAWVTAVTFLNDGHRKVVVGTGHHQVRLYDTSSQRRPVLAFDYGEAPVRTITKDPDGFSVYVGTGAGDLACFDIRTGKLLGGFKGKCAGSIRSVVRHPTLPLIASCGLDRFLRIHSTKTRQLLGSLFLKQQLVAVLFHTTEEKPTSTNTTAQDVSTAHPLNIEPGTSSENGENASEKRKSKRQAEEDQQDKKEKKIRQKKKLGETEEDITTNGSKKTKKSKSKAEKAQRGDPEEVEQHPVLGVEKVKQAAEENEEVQVTNGEKTKKKKKRQTSEADGEGVTEIPSATNGEKAENPLKKRALEVFTSNGKGAKDQGSLIPVKKEMKKSKLRNQDTDLMVRTR